MCLAVPVRIVERNGADATVEIDGVRLAANVAFVPDAEPGDYVLLHAGFAIRKWSEAEYREYRELVAGLDNDAARADG